MNPKPYSSAILALFTIAFLTIAFLTIGIAAAQTPAAPVGKNKSVSVYAELAKAPAKAAARQNPLETDPDAVAAGAKLFGLHCAECHGEMAEGTRKAPSLQADEVQQATPGTLFWLLTNGVVWHGMPVWSKLPDPQRWQLVSFIKSFSPTPPKSGPPKLDPGKAP
jgi:mono/diheme cytochrome c family protein